jgi:hypothetical protein
MFFFADPPPAIGERVQLTLHPDTHGPIVLDSVARYALPDVGVGVELSGPGSELDRYRAFVEEHVRATNAWQVVGGHIRSSPDAEAPDPIDFEQKEVIDVGESGEAYRVFFERYPPIPIERSPLKEYRSAIDHARTMVSGVSSDSVGIKLNQRDRLRRVYLGTLQRAAGHVAILPPNGPNEQFSIYSLSGREQLVIKEGDRFVFPFFTSSELARIRKDSVKTVRTQDVTNPAPPPPRREGSISTRFATAIQRSASQPLPSKSQEIASDSGEFRKSLVQDLQDLLQTKEAPASYFWGDKGAPKIPSLARWSSFDPVTKKMVEGLFDVYQAETRIYDVGGVQRRVRLLRNLPIQVRTAHQTQYEEGILLFDGKRICVVMSVGSPPSMRIRPLEASDQVRLPNW